MMYRRNIACSLSKNVVQYQTNYLEWTDDMRYDCAPMEGITGRHFRLVHNRWFGGIDQYYLPFLSPTHTHSFSKKEWQEVLPENNEGLRVVPQILTRVADDFLWAASDLAALGYTEVNLNLGCPSGTVVAKGKGSGFLSKPQELKVFLDQIFSSCPIKISIKTRLGLSDPQEFYPLLELFHQYPIHELIIHPRVQKDFYKFPARREVFSSVLPNCTLPICYNGDLATAEQCTHFCSQHPSLQAIMLGRGLIGDPALARKAAGGAAADKETLRAFHDELYECYCTSFNSRHNAMMRMKEIWFYLIGLFEDNGKAAKALRKTSDNAAFEAQVSDIFQHLSLRQENTTSCR